MDGYQGQTIQVDRQGRLLVGAAVGVGADIEERVQLMVSKGLDLVVVDTAHGHSKGVFRAIERIKSVFPDLPVVGGNVVTSEGAEALIKAGADIIKIGVGAGSICTTRVVSGAGRTEKPFLKAGEKYHLMKAKGHKYPRTRGRAMIAAVHPYGSSKRGARKATTTSHGAPPGRKVGLISARSTGKGKRRRKT